MTSKYSINCNDGKVRTFRYKKQSDFIYAFYLGELLMGQLFNMGKSWSAVSWVKDPDGQRKVGGFKTRHDAVNYLIQVGRVLIEGSEGLNQ